MVVRVLRGCGLGPRMVPAPFGVKRPGRGPRTENSRRFRKECVIVSEGGVSSMIVEFVKQVHLQKEGGAESLESVKSHGRSSKGILYLKRRLYHT